jgi:TrmH family RNA methyltransferase
LLQEFPEAGGRKPLFAPGGRFAIEDDLLIARALSDGMPLVRVLITGDAQKRGEFARLTRELLARNIPVFQISSSLMAQISNTRPTPPLVALAPIPAASASPPVPRPSELLLLTDDVANPDNLGMVIRTADAAGVSAVVVCGDKASPYHKNCVRAARGAVGRIPLASVHDASAYAKSLIAAGVTVAGTSAKAGVNLYAAELPPPLAFVVGNETHGLSPAMRDACTLLVNIPMRPGQSSLNVGVAAGVCLFEIRRRMLTD